MIDASILERYRALYSSLVSDCAEAAGLGCRALAAGLQPFHQDELRVVVGVAHTAQVHKTSERVEIDMLLKLIETTPADSVVVVATDEDINGALWGGLMSAGSQQNGAVGAVIDGGVRDLHQIHPLGFAVFAPYRSPLDIRGRAEMVSIGETVVCRGVEISPGDLVFADANGVVAIPAAAALEVLLLAEDRIAKEVLTEQELLAGAPASEVYARHDAF